MITNMNLILIIISPVCFIAGLLVGVFLTAYIQRQSLDAMQSIGSGESVLAKDKDSQTEDTSGEESEGYDEDDEWEDD